MEKVKNICFACVYVRIIHSEPQDMGSGDFWFQFRDTAGNIIDILGGK